MSGSHDRTPGSSTEEDLLPPIYWNQGFGTRKICIKIKSNLRWTLYSTLHKTAFYLVRWIRTLLSTILLKCCTWRLVVGVLTLWINSRSLPEVMASSLALSMRCVDSSVALIWDDSISLASEGRMGIRGSMLVREFPWTRGTDRLWSTQNWEQIV